MEEDILTQDEDLIDEEIQKEEEETKKEIQSKQKSIETENINPTEIGETYEAVHQIERFGIVNTLNGEIIDGFDPKKDEGLVKLGRAILNQLNKISIASGAQ